MQDTDTPLVFLSEARSDFLKLFECPIPLAYNIHNYPYQIQPSAKVQWKKQTKYPKDRKKFLSIPGDRKNYGKTVLDLRALDDFSQNLEGNKKQKLEGNKNVEIVNQKLKQKPKQYFLNHSHLKKSFDLPSQQKKVKQLRIQKWQNWDTPRETKPILKANLTTTFFTTLAKSKGSFRRRHESQNRIPIRTLCVEKKDADLGIGYTARRVILSRNSTRQRGRASADGFSRNRFCRNIDNV